MRLFYSYYVLGANILYSYIHIYISVPFITELTMQKIRAVRIKYIRYVTASSSINYKRLNPECQIFILILSNYWLGV